MGFATGWGETSDHGPISDQLKEVALTVIENNDCELSFLKVGMLENLFETEMCADLLKGGSPTCGGMNCRAFQLLLTHNTII